MYNYLVFGGTFDRLHKGHTALIDFAFDNAKEVIIGLTRESMMRGKQYAADVLPYAERLRDLRVYINNREKKHNYTIIPITDVYGTTLKDMRIEAIAVTPQTLRGAEVINAERKRRNMVLLPILVCPLVNDENGTVISSSRIRAGEIDRDGHVYRNLFSRDIALSRSLREKLRSPLGKLQGDVGSPDTEHPIVVIGDQTVQACVDKNIPFASAYGDERTRRLPYAVRLSKQYTRHDTGLINPPGNIKREVVDHMYEHLLEKKNAYYTIGGEEDLLTLVAICALPLGSTVFYGHPYDGEGVVSVQVTEKAKSGVRSMLLALG